MTSADTAGNRVAVIIVNYNAGDMLRRCLAALAAQTARPHRVLVMDNGSHDSSVAECESSFPWVEFHRLNANVGFARANNLAVELVPECEWLALLNPDAFADEHWLQSLLGAANRHSNIDVFASCMLSVNADVIDGVGDCYRTDGVAWPKFQGEPIALIPKTEREVFAACAGAGLYRRRVFIEAGGFNEKYFCYHEDVDLGFRLRLLGYRCRFVPQAKVRHVGSAIAGKGSDFSTYHAHRNMVWTYVRNMPGGYFWIHLPAHIAANFTTVGLFIAKGRGRIILRAKYHALVALPRIWRERREIQRLRRVNGRTAMGSMERGNLFTSLVRRAILRLRRLLGHVALRVTSKTKIK